MEPHELEIPINEWSKRLLSGDEILVKKTISELREKGNCELIPVLGTLLLKNPSEEISSSVISFLKDLKNQDCVPALVDVIKKSKGLEIFSALVSTAWENGLDYSEHLEFFINLVVDEDLVTAIEAFTVVEENIENLNPQKRNLFSKNIAQKSKSDSKEKAKLIEELLSVINIAPGPFTLDKAE